jgi:hypothetical protein
MNEQRSADEGLASLVKAARAIDHWLWHKDALVVELESDERQAAEIASREFHDALQRFEGRDEQDKDAWYYGACQPPCHD